MSEMYHVSPQDFGEIVCLSHSWSDLARRCGHTGVYTKSICTVLKQKVLFLKLDTQHFTRKTARTRRAWIAERVCEVGKCRLSDGNQMYLISPQEFTELVRVSKSWSDLASRCGNRDKKKNGGICSSLATVLKQKVLLLNLDTQHFGNGRERSGMAVCV